ncbi:DUF4381 domain-containing protein [Methylosarcina fibrata]|uniref:DUF4381 domain-containing protein n=1 Tax=Methylosarcina fibrata TaxID=105972 RepID=UPI0003610531|nr:DUF4381 domain-containing protein [Methylosarcina fibrata]
MLPVDLPLRDIHLPEAIGWWPPAPGWWLLAVLLPLLGVTLFRLYRHLTRKTALKTAKRILAAIRQDKAMDDLTKLSEISILLRRVAISTAPRAQAAGLTGKAWLAYLDRSMRGTPFSEGAGQYLSDARYRKEVPDGLDVARLIDLCEDWLKAQAKK